MADAALVVVAILAPVLAYLAGYAMGRMHANLLRWMKKPNRVVGCELNGGWKH